MKITAIIPARYKSTRFPGKPLVDINGFPMIWWVYQQAIKVKEFTSVYVATDSELIYKKCLELNINVLMTSENHQTGTDRLYEISKKIPSDLYVNIQGDEPLIEPNVIKKVIEPFYKNLDIKVVNLMTEIKDPVDIVNCTIPKVITNKENIGIYLTRSQSPYPKNNLDFKYYKQVCVYAFTKDALDFYGTTNRGKLELIEDIEILRFIENGWKVQYIEVDTNSVAVDTPKDLERVCKLL
jgi:3-deoxy-manno-octulosonate cytidylyltransferase (CMP-KDO synthetase)